MPNTTNLSNVNVGSSANAGDGDVLREAFIKVNANFININTLQMLRRARYDFHL